MHGFWFPDSSDMGERPADESGRPRFAKMAARRSGDVEASWRRGRRWFGKAGGKLRDHDGGQRRCGYIRGEIGPTWQSHCWRNAGNGTI